MKCNLIHETLAKMLQKYNYVTRLTFLENLEFQFSGATLTSDGSWAEVYGVAFFGPCFDQPDSCSWSMTTFYTPATVRLLFLRKSVCLGRVKILH